MININVFSKNHPNGERNRGCVKSPELLARIDKAIAEVNDLEQIIRCTNQCFVTPWLMSDLYGTSKVTVVNATKVEATKVEPTKVEVTKVEEPIKGTDPDGGVIGEQGEMGKDLAEKTEPEKTDVKDEGVNDEGAAPDTTESTNAPANSEPTEEIDGVPADAQESAPETQEPTPANEEQPEQPAEETAPKKGGRKKKDNPEQPAE